MSLAYEYQPLLLPRSIRVLYLQPSKVPDAPLSLRLRETTLDKARGNFDALSYVWGPPGNTKVICHGQELTIGPNCEAALRRLRSKKQERALFVDAICIDQTNDKEKEGQIKLMGDVYLYAKRVLIWLGHGSSQTDLAFKEIQRLYRFHRLLETKDNQPIISPQIEKFREWVWVKTSLHDLRLKRKILEDLQTHYWAAFLDFPYFERVWPLQETAVASRPLLICGNATVSFHAAKFALLFLTPKLSKMFREPRVSGRFNGYETHRELAHVFRLNNREIWKRPQDAYQLRAILFLVRRLQATEISDKLFSLYTILKNFCPEFPEPQKGIKPTDLWPSASFAVIRAMHCLDLIMDVHHERTDDLPSWSLDWSTNPNWYVSWDVFDDVLIRDTPIDTVWDNEPEASGSGQTKRLHIKGVRFSKVAKRSLDQTEAREWFLDHADDDANGEDVAISRENRPEFAKASEEVARMLFEWIIPKLGSPSPTEGHTSTLCHDLLLWDYPPSEDHDKIYQQWYETISSLQYLHADGSSNLPDTSAGVQEKLELVGKKEKFYNRLCTKRFWRCFFRTEDGRVGDGYHTIREGDLIVLLCWAKVPAILRPTEEDPSLYTLVSFVYIEGMVDCHAWDMKEADLEEFVLV